MLQLLVLFIHPVCNILVELYIIIKHDFSFIDMLTLLDYLKIFQISCYIFLVVDSHIFPMNDVNQNFLQFYAYHLPLEERCYICSFPLLYNLSKIQITIKASTISAAMSVKTMDASN